MNIAYLGNSFIYYNDLPTTLAALTPPTTVSLVLRGGASLTTLYHSGANHPLTTNTHTLFSTVANAFDGNTYDYTIMNDFSQGPARAGKRLTLTPRTPLPMIISRRAD